MPSGMRFSSASGSRPRRSRAASSRTSPPSTALGTPPGTLGPSPWSGRHPCRVPARPRPAGLTRATAAASGLAALAAVLALLLGAGGLRRRRPGRPRRRRRRAARSASPTRSAQEQRILNQRARAVRERDLDAVPAQGRPPRQGPDGAPAAATSATSSSCRSPGSPTGSPTSSGRACRLAQRWGDDVHIPQVVLTMQLEEYDAVPVERTVGFVFSFRDGRARIVSDRTSTGRPFFRGTPAPWDLTAITVREEPGVLGIFDRSTRASAPTVTRRRPQRASTQLDRALPFTWSGQVVVYSVENPRVLASFRDVPGGAIEHLGAMTFPTYAEDERSQVASTRMLLMPSSVRAGAVVPRPDHPPRAEPRRHRRARRRRAGVGLGGDRRVPRRPRGARWRSGSSRPPRCSGPRAPTTGCRCRRTSTTPSRSGTTR